MAHQIEGERNPLDLLFLCALLQEVPSAPTAVDPGQRPEQLPEQAAAASSEDAEDGGENDDDEIVNDHHDDNGQHEDDDGSSEEEEEEMAQQQIQGRGRDFLDQLLHLLPHPQPLVVTAARPPAAVPPDDDTPGGLLEASLIPAPVYPTTLKAMKEHTDHPLRMKLEQDEIDGAVSIKDAIHRTAGLDDISDFWCAQYALVCMDDDTGEVMMENVIERAEGLQVFRNRYEIAESYQEGCRALRRFAELCPNYHLAFMHNTNSGNYSVVRNLANFCAENFSPRDRVDFMVGYYYVMLSCSPDFHSIHKGTSVMLECKDMGWSKRHNMKLISQATSDCLAFIPYDICSLKFYNTGVGGAVFNAMRRDILQIVGEPRTTGEDSEWPGQKKVDFGCTYLEGLDSVFLVPDAATAQERALRNMEESLRLRFQNERRFSLDDQEKIGTYTDEEVNTVGYARLGY